MTLYLDESFWDFVSYACSFDLDEIRQHPIYKQISKAYNYDQYTRVVIPFRCVLPELALKDAMQQNVMPLTMKFDGNSIIIKHVGILFTSLQELYVNLSERKQTAFSNVSRMRVYLLQSVHFKVEKLLQESDVMDMFRNFHINATQHIIV